jgi:hypothetical protein
MTSGTKVRPLPMFLASFTGVNDCPDVVGHVWPRVALPGVEKCLCNTRVTGVQGADYLRPQCPGDDDSCAAEDKDARGRDQQFVQDGRVRARRMLWRQICRWATGL